MWGRARLGAAAAVVAIGLVAGCGGGGGGQNTTESFTPDELHAIQAATGNVAIYCTNQLVQRATGRTIAGGPVLADAEAGIATLLTLAQEKPTALWEPETTTTTTSTTTSSDTTGTTTTPSGTTGASTTSTTPTTTTGVVTGPRTLSQTLADLEQPVRAGCGQPLLGRLLKAIGQLTATTTSSTAPATTAAQTTPSSTGATTSATTQTAPSTTGGTTTSTVPAPTTQTAPPATAGTTTSTAPAPTTQTAPAGTAPSPPAAVPPPTPASLNGTGPLTSEIQISGATPLVATASYAGSGTFAVRLVPAGGGAAETLFQRVGSYSGQTLFARPRPGRYRVSVDAAGRWSLRLAQPQPAASAAVIPGRFSGTGSRVIPVQAAQALHARVVGSHPAGVSFNVALVSYAGAAPELRLFQKTGRFQGQTVTDVAAGPYLLRVQADGAWSVEFTPAGG